MNEFLDVMIEGKSNLERMEIQERGYDIGAMQACKEILNIITNSTQICFNCNKPCRKTEPLTTCDSCGSSWTSIKPIQEYVERTLRGEHTVTPLEYFSNFLKESRPSIVIESMDGGGQATTGDIAGSGTLETKTFKLDHSNLKRKYESF